MYSEHLKLSSASSHVPDTRKVKAVRSKVNVTLTKHSKQTISPMRDFPIVNIACGKTSFKNAMNLFGDDSSESPESGQKSCESFCRHCSYSFPVQDKDLPNISLRKSNVQYENTKNMKSTEDFSHDEKFKAKERLVFSRLKDNGNKTSQTESDSTCSNVLLQHAQGIQLFLSCIFTTGLSSLVKAHLSTFIYHVIFAIFLLICVSTRCEALESQDLKTLSAPCSHVSRATTRQFYIRHPSNCSIFYMCYGSQHWELSCTQNNTVFSLLHSVCVWKGSKYDDCMPPSTGLTTAYAWNRVPFLTYDSSHKLGKEIQHKSIDVVVSSNDEETQINDTIPSTDLKSMLPTNTQGSELSTQNDLWARSLNAVIELSQGTTTTKPSEMITISNTPTYVSKNETVRTTLSEFDYESKNIAQKPRLEQETRDTNYKTPKFETDSWHSTQVIRGYSIQYPIFDSSRPKRLKTEVYKSLIRGIHHVKPDKERTEDTQPSTAIQPNNVTSNDDYDLYSVTTTATRQRSSKEINNHNKGDYSNNNIDADSEDSWSTEATYRSTEKALSDDSRVYSFTAPFDEDINANNEAKDSSLKLNGKSEIKTGNENKDMVGDEKYNYRDNYIRDRWPQFDTYGTRFITTGRSYNMKQPNVETQSTDDQPTSADDSQPDADVKSNPDHEPTNGRISLLENNKIKGGDLSELQVLNDQLNDDRSDGPNERPLSFWPSEVGHSATWPEEETQKSMLTKAPETSYYENNAENFNQTFRSESETQFNLENQLDDSLQSYNSNEYKYWLGKTPGHSNRVTTSKSQTLQLYKSILSNTIHPSPDKNNKNSMPYNSKVSTMKNLIYSVKNPDLYVTTKGEDKHNGFLNTKRRSLSSENLKLSHHLDTRFPFGRPWSRLYPRMIESSIFKSTLRPVRRPSPPQPRKATDNPKLMDEFLRFLNISKPKSQQDFSHSKNNRIVKEKFQNLQSLNKRVTKPNFVKGPITQSPINVQKKTVSPKNIGPTSKKSKFTFSVPSITWTSKKRNFNQALTLPTKSTWSKDKFNGFLDRTISKYPVTKAQKVIKSDHTNHIVPYVPKPETTVPVPRSTIQKTKFNTRAPLNDFRHSLLAKTTSLPTTTRPPKTRTTPINKKISPTQRNTAKSKTTQDKLKSILESNKESLLRYKINLQKLKEKQVQAIQKPTKQNYATPKLITPWYPTTFQVFYQMYNPFVNAQNRKIPMRDKTYPSFTKSVAPRPTEPKDIFAFKRTNKYMPPSTRNKGIMVTPKTLKTTKKEGSKFTTSKTKSNTQSPNISQRKLDLLRQLTPKLWNRLVPTAQRRDITKSLLETTTMQIYVKPTSSWGQNKLDKGSSYWWDRLTHGPKYLLPTQKQEPKYLISTQTIGPKYMQTIGPKYVISTQKPGPEYLIPTQTMGPKYQIPKQSEAPTYLVPTSPVSTTQIAVTKQLSTTTLATTELPTTSSPTTTTTTEPPTTTTSTTTTTPEVTFLPTTTELDVKQKKLPPFVGPDYIPEYRKEMQDRCGIMGRPLIIGGRRSRSGQWPWQVSLQIVTSTTPWHRCGGVLVHARWVLTAAHCVEGSFYGDIRNWRVVLADYDLDTVSGNEIYRDVVRIISHPDYVRTSNFPNDIALLELDTPVDLTSGEVQTACLPEKTLPLGSGTQCWISGWGETRGSGGAENMMNEVPVDIVPLQECQQMWGKVNIDVLETQVCLGYGETGACYGDSGGPLMCEDQGRFYVAGVMSWLINNCSATNFPNVFTRLPNYMDWVYEHLDYFEWLRYL
ncbi:hypothetical protein BgiMline_019672 [Biomphalaria glabrata]|nr:elastase-1-like [Biomphalaria glabrata]